RRRVVVLAVVQLERALEHLGGLIALRLLRLGLRLAPGIPGGLLLLLRRSDRSGKDQRTRQQNADRALRAHAGTSLVVLGSTDQKGWGELFTTDSQQRKGSSRGRVY